MHKSFDEELRRTLSQAHHDQGIDDPTAIRLRKTLAEEFRAQLTIGVPTDEDERGLRRLPRQSQPAIFESVLFFAYTRGTRANY